MKCPFCKHPESSVKNSRPSADGTQIRRRRQCDSCGRRFTTFEAVELGDYWVLKRGNGGRQRYDVNKLRQSIEVACGKRPITSAQIDAVVNAVEQECFGAGERDVPTEKIGKAVLKRLRELDPIAYIRFASVYKSFHNLTDFSKEIRSLQKD